MALDRCYKQPKIVTMLCITELRNAAISFEDRKRFVGDGASISLSKTFHYIQVYC